VDGEVTGRGDLVERRSGRRAGILAGLANEACNPVHPKVKTRSMQSPPAGTDRSMMTMKRIDIAAIEKARRG
jgi:hypothetical protein